MQRFSHLTFPRMMFYFPARQWGIWSLNLILLPTFSDYPLYHLLQFGDSKKKTPQEDWGCEAFVGMLSVKDKGTGRKRRQGKSSDWDEKKTSVKCEEKQKNQKDSTESLRPENNCKEISDRLKRLLGNITSDGCGLAVLSHFLAPAMGFRVSVLMSS